MGLESRSTYVFAVATAAMPVGAAVGGHLDWLRTSQRASRPNRLGLVGLGVAVLLLAALPAAASDLPAPLSDLPLVEVPARTDRGLLAVHLTGDGGYDSTDKGIAEGLAHDGIPVVALNTRKYFGTERTPDAAAEDLSRILRHYLEEWRARQFVAIGYSFGANVMPYLVTRLPHDLHVRLRSIALIAPTANAEFKVTLAERLGLSTSARYPVVPELERLRGTPILCFYGESDRETIGSQIDASLVTRCPIPGGHDIGKRSELIVEKILQTVREGSSPVPVEETPGKNPKGGSSSGT
jgi:type IV secretory pathway VirJ component